MKKINKLLLCTVVLMLLGALTFVGCDSDSSENSPPPPPPPPGLIINGLNAQNEKYVVAIGGEPLESGTGETWFACEQLSYSSPDTLTSIVGNLVSGNSVYLKIYIRNNATGSISSYKGSGTFSFAVYLKDTPVFLLDALGGLTLGSVEAQFTGGYGIGTLVP